jgi:hypothetical protein
MIAAVTRALLLCAAAALAAGCSARQLSSKRDWAAGGTLAYDLAYRRAFEPGAPVDGVVTGGVRVRGVAGPSALGWAFGVDLAAGGSHPRGFAWRAVVSPVGVGVPLGRHGLAGVIAGIGGSGITGRVDSSMELPAEAFVSLRLGSRAGVTLWAQPAWLPLSDARAGGAPDIGFVDEFRAGLTFRAGRNYHKWSFRSGNGYHLGLLFAEDSDTRFAGVTVGYDLDASTE